MKKGLLWIIMTAFLLQGCREKQKEEAINTITEYKCEISDVVFFLDGLWEANIKEESNTDLEIELSACHIETGSEILVCYDELEDKKGGNLFRLDDYLLQIIEKLENSKEYNYTLSEVSDIILYDESYKAFQAITDSPSSKHYFYVREKDKKIVFIVVTVYEEDNINEITQLGKKINRK